jgi:hypothetical protein
MTTSSVEEYAQRQGGNLMPGGKDQREGSPTIDEFLLYAERSIKAGQECHLFEGDLGIRTPVEGKGAQLTVGRHTRCRNLYSPSASLAIYSEVRDVWTDALQRVQDIGIGTQHKFPGDMPELPLAMASGSGRGILLHRHEQNSLGPGVYGELTMLYESELWLAAGTYVFSRIRMDEKARLFALPGGVSIGVVGSVWTDRFARIVVHGEDAKASRFTISVAGNDLAEVNADGAPGESTPVVVIGEEAHVHALLAAPHGTVQLKCGARIKGAVAAFDILAEDRVHAEFQSGFPVRPAGQQGSQKLSGYFGVPAPAPALLGPVPQDTEMLLSIGLPVRNPKGLNDLIKQVSDPNSANFRKFISQADFKNTYGATDADYQGLKNWAGANGLATVSTYSNNLLLSVKATAAAVEQALFVNLVFRQRADGSKYVAVDRDPSLNLSVPVLEINGLNSYFVPRLAATSTGEDNSYNAADLRNAYLGVGSALQALNGSGQVVGIVGFDVYHQSDVDGYAGRQFPVAGQQSPLPPVNVTIVARESGLGIPPSDSDLEAAVDVQMVYAMAPAAQILFFQANNGISLHLDDIYHAMATSSPPLTVATSSLFVNYSNTTDQALGEMAATGVTFFQSSGDSGDVGGNDLGNIKFANQTVVGGTILHTNSLVAAPPNPVYPSPYYASENTWNQGKKDTTGGGVMPDVTIPDYQAGVSMATNGGSTKNRNYPDVAIVASSLEFYYKNPSGGGRGTSAAAPLWAGLMALINQLNQQNGGPGRSGFINPTIYDIGITRGTANDLYKICFNDIADGVSNGVGNGGSGFSAVAGYDLCTGWGSPQPGLVSQLASPTPLGPNPLSLIRFVITTGQDDAGGGLHGSSQTADCFLPGGGVFTVPLRNAGEDRWQPWTTHVVDFPIPATDNNGNPVPPLTTSQGLTGVQIHQIQSNPDFSTDNWDIANLQVSLFNPGSPRVRQIDLIGTSVLHDGSTGLVRLTKKIDFPGGGPDSPVYPAGPDGTPVGPTDPLSAIRFVITTGQDNAGQGQNGSSQTADCFLPGGGVFTLTLRGVHDPHWEIGSTHVVDFPIPATDSNGNPVPVLTPSQGLTGVRINLVQNNPDLNADNWDIENLRVSLNNPGSVQVCQLDLVGTNVLHDNSIGLIRLSKNVGGNGSGPATPVYPAGPGGGC